jgi:riboflavin synthase
VFTGIVESTGVVTAIDDVDGGRRFVIESSSVVAGLDVGGSVSVQGACLTAIAVSATTFTVELITETLRRTALGATTVGTPVNLERAMPASGRFDGHIVQGHVDGVGVVRSLESEGEGFRLSVECPPDIRRYVVEKGSITVHGVSLTVAGVDDDGFEVALIPHTLEVTTLGLLRPSARVNLEVDILAKYIERLMETKT